jgi:hypothetical protein
MRLRFQRRNASGWGAPNEAKIAEWAQQAETARLTTIRQQERAVRIANKRRTQTTQQTGNPTSPELAAKQHQPNTHLNPRSRAKTACLTP